MQSVKKKSTMTERLVVHHFPMKFFPEIPEKKFNYLD